MNIIKDYYFRYKGGDYDFTNSNKVYIHLIDCSHKYNFYDEEEFPHVMIGRYIILL